MAINLFDTVWHKWLKRPYRLAVAEVGKGSTQVVLLHGVAARGKMLMPLARALPPDKYRVIVPDLLGCGDSPKPQWMQYTVEDHAKAVIKALKKHKVHGPAIVMGHSMGCLVAAHLAAERPDLVKRLVLYEPPLLGEHQEFPEHTRRSEIYKKIFDYIASHPELAHVDSKIFWRLVRSLWGTHLSPEEWVPFERSLRNTIMSQSAYEELRDINIQTDIVYGRLDLVVIRQGIEKLFKHNDKIALHLVTDIHGLSKRSAACLVDLITGNKSHIKRSGLLAGRAKGKSGI